MGVGGEPDPLISEDWNCDSVYLINDQEINSVCVTNHDQLGNFGAFSISQYDTNGLYLYTHNLLTLNSFCNPVTNRLPMECLVVNTPLNRQAWQAALVNHPDRQLVHFLVEGIRQGFRIGFDYSMHSTKSKTGNMKSACDNPVPVNQYLDKELTLGRIFEVRPELGKVVHISKFGVIPKSGQPGKWRLILDLSSPRGSSVNDGVDKRLCSMHYTTFEDALRAIRSAGPGALLAKIDVKEAYRNIPVHPSDRHLLGMSWQGRIFVDGQLPFGLRSAPVLFSALADALEWVFWEKGITFCVHYLDDFLTLGPANSGICTDNLRILTETCSSLGVPLKVEKLEGPATRLVFLGIEIDTVKWTMSLPEEKMLKIKLELLQWKSRRSARQRELLSLIGKLAHACKVIRPGKIFLRRMIDLAHTVHRLEHWIRLSAEFQSDLWWWISFMELWNGKEQLSSLNRAITVHVTSDASGSWGCGAAWVNHWIQCKWDPLWAQVNIAAKEFVPIVLAAAVWGNHWRHHRVVVHCDNMAVVSIWAAQSSKHPLLMHLLRCMHFVCAYFDLDVQITHIKGVDNIIADAISRNLTQVLYREAPDLDCCPTKIPQPLWELLVTSQPDWLSPHWNLLWQTFLQTV